MNTFDPLMDFQGRKLLGVRNVPVGPLAGILDDFASEREIDFLNVDAEGSDLEVLASNDWKRFRPSVVLVEIRKKGLMAYPEDEIYRLMSANGYELFAKTFQTAFFRDGRSVSGSRWVQNFLS